MRGTLLLVVAGGAAVALTGWIGAGRPVDAKARPIDEVKAAYAYQFTGYIEWPDGAFESDDSPFRICVTGNESLVDYLRGMTTNKSFDSRAIVVASLDSHESVDGCDLLFVGKDGPALEELGIDSLAVPPLTVGDSKNFIKEGGIIRLYESSSRVRIEINIDAAKRHNYKISSKLLGLANVVHDE